MQVQIPIGTTTGSILTTPNHFFEVMHVDGFACQLEIPMAFIDKAETELTIFGTYQTMFSLFIFHLSPFELLFVALNPAHQSSFQSFVM